MWRKARHIYIGRQFLLAQASPPALNNHPASCLPCRIENKSGDRGRIHMHNTAEAQNYQTLAVKAEFLQSIFRLPVLVVVEKESHHLVVRRPSCWWLQKMPANGVERQLVGVSIRAQGI